MGKILGGLVIIGVLTAIILGMAPIIKMESKIDYNNGEFYRGDKILKVYYKIEYYQMGIKVKEWEDCYKLDGGKDFISFKNNEGYDCSCPRDGVVISQTKIVEINK